MAFTRIGKYSCLEIEKRFLLEKLPSDLKRKSTGWLIVDRYLPDTHLRLRKMESLATDKIIYKLTKKFRDPTQPPSETTITNIYLNRTEFQQFIGIPAKEIKKNRFEYQFDSHKYSIDVFQGGHRGLLLAEIEFEGTMVLEDFSLPSFAFKEVTADLFFVGGNLAFLSDKEFIRGLSQRLPSD